MQLRSLLLLAILAASTTAGCGVISGRGAASPEGLAGEPAAGGSSEADESAPPRNDQGGANPAEPSSHPPGFSAGARPLPAPVSRDERNTRAAGIALTAIGGASAVTGGLLLGLTGSACHGEDQSCPGRVALPIVGTLWIAAGVVPLVLGVSIWAPRASSASSTSGPAKQGESRPPGLKTEVRVGPSAASVLVHF